MQQPLWPDDETETPDAETDSGVTIWTIGHSNRAIDEFVALLQAHRITRLIDVRRFPASRAHPHFNSGPLADALAQRGLGYESVPELGGRRQPAPDSHNTAWRNQSFRGYADYMETAPFQAAIDRLAALAVHERIAIMCSEALWWRCHRALIADELTARGVAVRHIMSAGAAKRHTLTSAATLIDGRLSYRARDDGQPPETET